MSEDTLQLLFNSNLTWATALTIMSIVLRSVLFELVKGTNEARRTRARLEEQRAENEKDQTRVMGEIRESIDSSKLLTQGVLNLLQPVSQVPEKMDEATRAMKKRADDRDSVINDQTARLTALRQFADKLPGAVLQGHKDHFDPQLKGIKDAIAELRQYLEQAPPPLTANDVRELRQEIARLARALTSAAEREQNEPLSVNRSQIAEGQKVPKEPDHGTRE